MDAQSGWVADRGAAALCFSQSVNEWWWTASITKNRRTCFCQPFRPFSNPPWCFLPQLKLVSCSMDNLSGSCCSSSQQSYLAVPVPDIKITATRKHRGYCCHSVLSLLTLWSMTSTLLDFILPCGQIKTFSQRDRFSRVSFSEPQILLALVSNQWQSTARCELFVLAAKCINKEH